ncbi:hypothetical protein IW261DRAFT_451592 [Armillaria novae-zelandiae]|uniref:Uncharacterized protein n=1 Tax=Armillaria novae-zelandiae TaxID=153914 RepID=A0AA39N6A4_9AGAR|nr:hypothetical protein IW261DRAFT_451592 [Armillaria novae-zelandiae]
MPDWFMSMALTRLDAICSILNLLPASRLAHTNPIKDIGRHNGCSKSKICPLQLVQHQFQDTPRWQTCATLP